MSDDIKALFEGAQEIHSPQLLDLDPDADLDLGQNARVLLVPKGMQAIDAKPYLEKFRVKPERTKGTANLHDLPSFIAHANRFKDASSALFADSNEDEPKLIAVLDYSAGPVPSSQEHPASDGDPRWHQHRGVYAFPLSEAWETWRDAPAEMGQASFAEFIEDNIADILDPSLAGAGALETAEKLGVAFAGPTKMMELARGVAINVDKRVAQAVTLATGEGRINYEENHSAPVTIPGAFLIAIPVFKSGALYQVPVRLRYRVKGGSVVWFIELYRTDLVFEHAFREACDTAQKGTELPLFVGTPEV